MNWDDEDADRRIGFDRRVRDLEREEFEDRFAVSERPSLTSCWGGRSLTADKPTDREGETT